MERVLDFFPLRLRQFPDVVQELFHGDAFFGIGLAAYRNPGLGHRLGPTRHQGMPPGEAFSLIQQAVGAGLGKPAELADIISGQCNTIRHPGGPVRVIRASAGLDIKQLAGGTGIEKLARILILQLVQAAAAAAIAQTFPLCPAHLGERFGLPKGEFACHGSS
jgi:hypothetical protein